MSEPSDDQKTLKAQRDKIVGLGKRSICKSYFPLLQRQIEELEKSQAALEIARKNAEESEARLQSLFEAAPVGMGVMTDGRFLFVNQTLCDMLGYPAGAFIGNRIRFVFLSDEDHSRVTEELQRQIGQSGKGTIETRLLCRDGGVMDVLMSSCPIDKKDWSKGVTFTVLDIAERKKMISALRLSEEKYRELVENINEAIFVTDLAGIILFISPKIETFLNYTPDEITGKPFIDFVYREDTELIKARFQSMTSGAPTGFTEYRFVHKSGSIVWIRASSRPVYKKDRIIGLMGTLVDITKQKQLEERLAQAQKMEAVGTLAGGIAHDFNNILMVIIGNTELAQEDIHDAENIEIYLKEVFNASLRAKDLVKQILTFSRMTETTYSPVDPLAIIKESLKMLRSLIPSTIEIRQDLAASGLIMSDPTQINQIIMNLCTNAVHAMEENGGVLEVLLNETTIDDSEFAAGIDLVPGRYLKLTVRDNGEGIAPEFIDRIFEPYFTTKALERGTGLGLSVIHGIVKSHNGAIVCRSIPNQGSTFDVFFPMIKSIKTKNMVPEEKPVPGGAERILFVDDEPAIAKMTEKLLSNMGYRVVTKTDSIEAFERFREDPRAFDLVITDMTMPGMTGEKLAREILAIRNDIPIILSTGYNKHISEEKTKALGIREFIIKPFDMKKLAGIIRKALRSNGESPAKGRPDPSVK